MAYLDKVTINNTTYNIQDTSTQTGVSNVFSTTTAYSAGQYVWYDGDGTGAKLYRFTADHAAGAWVGTDAIQVAIANDVKDLKSAIVSYMTVTNPVFTLGSINTSNGNNSSSTTRIRNSTSIPLEKGSTIRLSGNYKIAVYRFYGSQYGGYDKMLAYLNSGMKYIVVPETTNYKFVIAKQDDGTITDEEIASIIQNLLIQSPVYKFETTFDRFSRVIIPFEAECVYGYYGYASGAYNQSRTGITTINPIDSSVYRIIAPTGIICILYAFDATTGEYIGWSSGGAWSDSSSYRYAQEITISGELIQNHYNIFASFAKSDSSGFDTNDVAALGVTTETITKYLYDNINEQPEPDAPKSATTTVLGYDLPENADADYNLTAGYAEKMKEAIAAWGGAYAGDAMLVPFVLHTDQHGRLNSNNKGVFDLLSYLVNWDQTSAILNLGDTVVDHWEDDNTNTNPLLRNETLENALKCLENIPLDKQINVWGNHDTWYQGAVETAVSGVLPSLQYNNPYFKANGLRTERCIDNSGLMVVYDDQYKIRYIVIADWDYTARSTPNRQYYYVSAEHWQWIIDRLTENIGYDIVILSHVPIILGTANAYNPITEESATQSTVERFITQTTSFDAIWTARKNLGTGTISPQGQQINYDFSGCTDKFLCALAGHQHNDVIDYTTGDNGLLCATFDWFADRTIHFGLIDRRNSKVMVWKLSNVSDTPAVESWEAPFDYE